MKWCCAYRFLEMPIVVQGCEDAIVEALSPDTLPAVLRWASAPHASPWVHRYQFPPFLPTVEHASIQSLHSITYSPIPPLIVLIANE